MSIEEEVLAARLSENNDAGVETVREYLFKLLYDVWLYDEGFDGKRPFGNSGWKWELYIALIRAGIVNGSFDEYGYVDEFSDEERGRADSLIFDAIRYMCLG